MVFLEMLLRVNKESIKKGIVTKGLLEVNVSQEESKYGFTGITDKDLQEISRMSNLSICGLMTVAPYVEDSNENRTVFCTLKQLSVDINSKNIDNVNMDCLSMGMSGDYKVAILHEHQPRFENPFDYDTDASQQTHP